MAKDIIPMEPEEAVCPHCGGKVLVVWQIAVNEGSDSFQFAGLRIAEPKKIHNPVTSKDYPVRPRRATAEALRRRTYTPKSQR